MNRREVESILLPLLQGPRKQKLIALFPPVSGAEIEEVYDRARSELQVELVPEYRWLVSIIDGGGDGLALYGAKTREITALGRKKVLPGIIEQNLELREDETIGQNEMAYGERDGCLVLHEGSTGWVIRDISSKQVMMRLPTFADLLKRAFT
jgi:hypothetical protein